jgi:solute carrier family 25 phosphate transporter 3
LLSKINKQKNTDPNVSIASRLWTLAKELGPRGLFIGLGARLVMVLFAFVWIFIHL